MLHDYAKSTDSFQKRVRKKEHNLRESRHGHLSAVVAFHNIWNLLDIQNVQEPKSLLPLFAYLAIKQHHGNLGSAQDDLSLKDSDIELMEIQLGQIDDRFIKDLHGVLNQEIENPVITPSQICSDLPKIRENLRRYKKKLRRNGTTLTDAIGLSYLYSLLIDADKLEASGAGMVPRPDLPDDFIVKHVRSFGNPVTKINRLRTKALNEVLEFAQRVSLKERLLSLTLPTGLGKTYSVIALAQKLRHRVSLEEGYKPRIIYCLPFTSIIDQNWSDLYDILNKPPSSRLLKHHHMGDTLYHTGDGQKEYSFDESHLLIEGWNSEIVVTTFVQLFFTLAGYRNRSLRRFHNIAGSIIILDEVQSIPFRYWKLFREIAKTLAETLGTRFILVTATQPAIFDSIPEVIQSPEEYFGEVPRVTYDIDLTDTSLDDFKNYVLDSLVKETNNDLLLVLNTKKSAEEIYCAVKNAGVNADLIFLTTSIIPRHRMERISKIRRGDTQDRILVSTQIVEAGVDIDFSTVARDFAPLDSIIQASGRCNRNMLSERGTCYVRYIKDERTGRAFSSYIYDATLLDTTRRIIEAHNGIDESNLHSISSEYFREVSLGKSSSDSSRILADVAKLGYHAFADVRLIDDQPLLTDVFIEYDTHASNVLSQYKELVGASMPRFRKRQEFLKIRRDLMEYIISVPAKNLGAVNYVGTLAYISAYDIDRRYDDDTGFIPAGESAIIL